MYEIDILYDGDPPGIRLYVLDEDREQILDAGPVGLDIDAGPELYKAWVEYHNPERTTSQFFLSTSLNPDQQTLELELFDTMSDGPDPVDTVEVGSQLEYDLLSEAYSRFQSRLEPDHPDRQ